MRYILFVLSVSLVIFACKEEKKVVVEKKIIGDVANVDSLSNLFMEGWNRSDSAAIMSTIADQAVLFNDSAIHTGAAAIASNWVSGGVKVLSNIVIEPKIKGAAGVMAYNAGTYSLNLNIPNGPVLKEQGNYSLVWERQKDDSWKLTMIHIEDVTRMPDVK